jgi:hypothetical protein
MMVFAELKTSAVSAGHGELGLAVNRCHERVLSGEMVLIGSLSAPCRTTIYRSPMRANIAYWRAILRELDAATTVAAMKVAASKLMDAKVKLKRLQAEASAVEA